MAVALHAWCDRCGRLTTLAKPVERIQVRGSVAYRSGHCSVCGDSVVRVGGAAKSDAVEKEP